MHNWLAEHPGARLRLLGVGGSDLAKDAQPDMFAPEEDGSAVPLDRTVDRVRDRFGNASLSRARALDPDQIR